MVKHEQKAKPAQVHDGVVDALREMVRVAEEAGQRDQPHVMKAREALADKD